MAISPGDRLVSAHAVGRTFRVITGMRDALKRARNSPRGAVRQYDPFRQSVRWFHTVQYRETSLII